jgi:mono/diheme cytochrome c family protein
MAVGVAKDAQSSHDQRRRVALPHHLVTGTKPPPASAAESPQASGEASPAAWLDFPNAASIRDRQAQPDPSVTPEAPAPPMPSQGLGIRTLLMLAAIACIVLMLLVVPASRQDPYSRATLALSGSAENGGRLFRLNCAGCHGLAAQGLVGPNLHGVSHRKNDRQLIQQVVSGNTPPMPRFQPEPQAMADLLAFLHSLPD